MPADRNPERPDRPNRRRQALAGRSPPDGRFSRSSSAGQGRPYVRVSGGWVQWSYSHPPVCAAMVLLGFPALPVGGKMQPAGGGGIFAWGEWRSTKGDGDPRRGTNFYEEHLSGWG